MKKIFRALLVGAAVTLTISCQDFLDVNTNPNAPQVVTANLYLPPLLHWMTTSPLLDGRFVGRYTQNYTLTGLSLSSWDRMGYDAASDAGAQQWRDVYWTFGQNLVDMTNKAEAEQRWDLLGVAYVLKAWGWQVLADLHGELPIKEAIDPSRTKFDYDTQEFAYTEVQRLLNKGIEMLARTDGAVDQTYLGKTDKIYNGDRAKWTKLAYAMLALNLNHYSNKGSYKPADVIAAVDKSFIGNSDEPLLTYPNTQNDDINFLGRTRGNFNAYRQTQFVVGLLDGTQFGTPDPRLSRMMSPSPDGLYRGLDPNVVGFGALATAQQPAPLYGSLTAGQPGRYIFDDKAKIAVMTYAEVQFIKAEAAYRMGDKALALTAYRNGVSAHIDWVNSRNADNSQAPTQITAAEKTAFLASTAVVPAAGITLTNIMSQKYIAQWGWGHNETWMDLRRYHYTDIDPVGGKQIYPGYTPPTNLFPDNSAKVVERIRPRYNSEYVWNRDALMVIGGLDLDYHTKRMWIIQP